MLWLVTSPSLIGAPKLSPEVTPPAMESIVFGCFLNQSDAKVCQQAPWDFYKSHSAVLNVERQQWSSAFAHFYHHVCKHQYCFISYSFFLSYSQSARCPWEQPTHSGTTSIWHKLMGKEHLLVRFPIKLHGKISKLQLESLQNEVLIANMYVKWIK